MSKVKLIVGIALILIGLVLLFFSLPGIIYGIILIILGLGFIIFRKNENMIEERRDLNRKKSR